MARIFMAVYNTIQNDARVIRAAEALADEGHEIIVASCNSDLNYSNPKFKSIVYTRNLDGPKLLLKFWKYVKEYVLLHKDEIDLIYMHDYFMPFIGYKLKKSTGLPFVYDAHELLIQRKNHKMSLREKLFYYIEKKTIRHADLVIAANDERLRIINSIYKLNNSISVGNIAEVKINKEETPLTEDIIVYQGILNEERKVSNYIKLLKYLPENIKIKLIGGGEIDYYKTLAQTLGVSDRVIFTGRIPYSKLIDESRICKVGFVSYRMDDLNNLYCSPNKLFEYLQFGLPVIVSPQPFLLEVVNKYGVGEVWDERSESIEELANKVIRIIRNHSNYQKGMTKFNKDYNNRNEMKKLITAIKNLL